MSELHDDLTPDDLKAQWLYIENFYDSLWAICNRTARYDAEVAESLMHEVVYERLWRILELYDPSKGALTHYVNRNIKMYCVKHLQVQARKAARYVPLEDSCDVCYVDSHEARLEVSILLDSLTEYERFLVYSNIALGTSIRELSTALDVSRIKVSADLKNALKKLREKFTD